MMPTKNKSNSGINNRNYSLLGDPALTLNYPIEDIALTKVNGINVSEMLSDTIKALEKLNLKVR